MKIKKYNNILRHLTAVSLLVIGQQIAFAVVNDSVCVAPAQTMDCCVDSVPKDDKSPYAKLMKEGGSMREGLFTVRHIKADWYLEVPDSLVGRLMLAVTRFASVPQGFKLLAVRK
jgi:hypothetical protein